MKKIVLFLIFPLFLLANSSVLIINSYHKGYEWSDDVIMGIENSFYTKKDIHIDTLYMDSKRVVSKEYFDNLKKLYGIQLQKQKYDLIIAIDRFAYDFVLENYNNFFTDEKILAVGLEEFSHEKAKKYNLKDKISVLLEKRDLDANIKIVKDIIPHIKKLYIINDISLNALHTEPLIYNTIKKYKDSYEIKYLKEKDIKSLKKIFSKKDSSSAGVFIRFYKSENGKFYKNYEIAEFIKNSKIPIFVTDSLFIKKGAIGGKIIDLKLFGKVAGNIALDILKNNTNIIKTFDDMYYIFDAQKLDKFDYSINDLKIKYKLVNKKKTFFDKYKGFIDFVFTISPFLILLIIGLFHNIYMRKKTEKKLRDRVNFDEILLNTIENPIFWEDKKGNIVECNSKFCNLVDLLAKDIYGKKLQDFKTKIQVKKILEILEDYKKYKNKNYEYSFYDRENNHKIFLINQKRFKDRKAKIEGYVTIFIDITEKKQIEEERQKNKQFIIQQSKLAEIGEVFSSIAHQWKTPLIEITTIAQELFYSRKNQEVENIKEDESFVKDIMTQVSYMTDTINDFQKFIIPSNQQVEFDVYESIEQILKIVNHNIRYNNIKVNIEVEENTNLKVFGYKNECMQSFLNIINNSKDALMKNHYKNRFINIKIFNKDRYLYLTIEDNAGGIKCTNINNIFKPYFTTKEKGHGIGLYMSKMIIEDKMKGSLRVKNKENGAIFTIKLEQNK